MQQHIIERTMLSAKYIVKHNATVRDAGKALGISKSTVHKDMTERLNYLHKRLYEKVKEILKINLDERHIRGGEATRIKYKK